ncbi:HAMP domain-containing histidine kinase [Pseudomonas aeruginosa]|nr:HAMP domain-containing histidine kinase [Pseudomonas aeruginosa]
MRSLFWRILAAFWLALLLVAGLSILLGRALNQDTWIIARHPGLKDLAEQWTALYEEQGSYAAQGLLEQRRRDYGISIQVLDESGQRLVDGTYLPRPHHRPPRTSDRNLPRSPWRQLSQEYVSPQSNHTYLFIYRIPHPELEAWHRGSLLWPLSALGIALVVLTLFSLLLTLSITRPLNRLRRAVHDLGQTAYQKDSLARLARRGDELGTLARDFNRMGERLQSLIGSQRQLLRDVSHELRSPLARLRIALALAERAEPEARAQMWPRLEQECDRLEALIGEILALARLDAEPGASQRIALLPLLQRLREDALLLAPEQDIRLEVAPDLSIDGWPDMFERAVDNLLRNAVRFNPVGQPLEVRASSAGDYLRLSVRDHGPGIAVELQEQLGEPFFRAPNQSSPGHGLGLAIARRAIERHGGHLRLGNHPDGGFIATLSLPLRRKATE